MPPSARGIAVAPLAELAIAGSQVVPAPAERLVREQGHDLAGPIGADEFRPVEDGPGQPWVRPHRRHLTTARGDAAIAIRRIKTVQQRSRGIERDDRRLIEQGKTSPARSTPRGRCEREPGQVGRGDLGQRVRGEVGVVGLRPAAVHATGRLAAGPSSALIGGRLRHPGGDQRAQAAGLVGARFARQPGVDDRAHAGHRQRAFGDRGGDDDAAPRPASEGEILLDPRLPSEQRANVGVNANQGPSDEIDLAFARHEDEHITVAFRERAPGDVGDVLEQFRIDTRAGQQRQRTGRRRPHDFDRIGGGGRGDHRRIERAGERDRVRSRRSRDHHQVIT